MTKKKTAARREYRHLRDRIACVDDGITPEEILCICLVLGFCDDKVQEWLLQVSDLTLQRAIDICKAAEQTNQQLKVMQGTSAGLDTNGSQLATD